MAIREQLDQHLDEGRRRLGASSCTFYLREPKWPGEFRLVAMSGVRYVEPMFGFVPAETTRRFSEGDEEIFQNLPSEKVTLPAIDSLLTDVPEENRRLFGDFRERENVRAYARITNGEAVLFVNYDRDIAFEQTLRSAIHSLFSDLVTNTHGLQQELAESEAEWRSEATRIVSPLQTIANINFYTLEKPDLFFAQVIEAALRVLNIPEGTGLGVIHLYNSELGVLELRGSFGPIEHIERARRHSVTKGDGVVSWVALTRGAVVIQDLAASDFRRIHIWINGNSKSELAVPIEVGGELIGSMCLECTEANRFKPHHARSVWYAANKAAIAYQLHQLTSINKELLQLCWRATNIEGGAPVSLGQVATLAKDFLKASSCDISRYNPDTGRFDVGEATYGGFEPQIRADGWTNFIWRVRSPVWIGDITSLTQYSIHVWEQDKWNEREQDSDYPTTLNKAAFEGGVRSALGIPITVHDQCIAVAWLRYRRERLECPKPGLMSLALGFAAEAGLVLDSIERQEIDLKERGEIESVGGQITSLIDERWKREKESDVVEASVCSHPYHWKLGGDFYARKVIDERTSGILLVDGQGHGVAGSLHMLPLMAAFESSYDSYSTAHVVSQLAKTAESLGVRGTAVYCLFSKINGSTWLSATSAGHESLIVFTKQKGRWSYLYFPDPTVPQAPMFGHPLSEPFIDHRRVVESGDVVVGYTDGIAEQNLPFNPTHLATFITERLDEAICEPEKLARVIMEHSREKHSYSFGDDATVFVARVKDVRP